MITGKGTSVISRPKVNGQTAFGCETRGRMVEAPCASTNGSADVKDLLYAVRLKR